MNISDSLRVRGFGGTIHLIFLRIFNFNRTPGHIVSRMLDLRKFDRVHNVETAGLIELDELMFDSPHKADGTRYGGIQPWRLKNLIDKLSLKFDDYTFIDIGSGKGAALFHASDYPFRKIIGVEFSPELHEVALRNIARFRSRTQTCNDITSICGDGGAYEYPEGPWVLFFNTTFGVQGFQRVAENLVRANWGSGPSFLIYCNFHWRPDAAEFVHNLAFLKMIHEDDTSRIYELTRQDKQDETEGATVGLPADQPASS